MLNPEIADALARGCHVVTGNQRAARTLRTAFDAAMGAAGRSHWEPAAIFTLEQWLSGLWHRRLLEGLADRVLLNRSQEQALWRSVIHAEDPGLAAASLAPLAAEAWSRLLLYRGRGRLREAGISTDTRAFQRWVQGFERRLGRERWLTAAQLPVELQAAAESGELPVPNSGLLLHGFDAIAPAVAGLFECLRAAGFVVRGQGSGVRGQGSGLHVAVCEDEAAEIRAAARFAKERLGQEPGVRIAVVVPNLAERKPAIGSGFRGVFGAAAAFEFSLGQALAETPLGATALDLLRWTQHPIALETVSALLLSPWFGCSLGASGGSSLGAWLDDPAITAAAEFDAFELRRLPLLRPELSLAELIGVLEGAKRQGPLSDLLARLRAMREAVGAQAPASHAGWGEWFRGVLEGARLARFANSDSIGFQMLHCWESALDELATLDFDGVAVSAGAALEALERIARETIFAPESQDAPIQMMGPLEAAGSEFDVLWVLGAGEKSWPPRSATTPLLPWRLQQQLGMPGADVRRERELAERLTARLAGSAGTVVFSYAAMLADGVQGPSPLLAGLGLSGLAQPSEFAGPALALDLVPDVTALPPLPERAVRGGASVLAAQAACPFQAFATYRLGSSELEARDTGQDARERGSDVHRVMQAFWAAVKDREALLAMTEGERNAELDRCIALALGRTRVHSTWDGAYVDVQRQRLRQLLRPWLAFEAGRPAFAVRQQEGEQEAALGPLRLRLRYDRVDQTKGGDLILDYKTGAASSKDWLSERPDAPQLPLYAVLHEAEGQGFERLGGVAFALLRPGKGLDLEGFAVDETVLDKPKKSDLPFDLQLEAWRRVLTNLAEDFADGVSTVDPKQYPTTCQRCSQRILCRLNPATLDLPDDAFEGEQGEEEVGFG
jgi:probable DNA repair protein